MAARIERQERAEKQRLANVSHELRTPLARIRVVLELASEGDPQRVRAYLSEIAHDLAELERLVDDVITTARLDAGSGGTRVPLRLETIDPKKLGETSRARFESIHPGRALALRMDRLPEELRCDPMLLRRAIDNLLDNAAKYAPDSRIELSLVGDGDDLAIEVMDLGPGMNEEQAAHAFDPFYRADASRMSAPGVGLGLSIVRRVVEAHGGSLDLETAPGRGTSITARVPIDRARPRALPEAHPRP
jgi:signal transduction histidine kinase